MSDMKFGIDIVRYRRIIKKKLLLKSWRIRKIDVYMDFFTYYMREEFSAVKTGWGYTENSISLW